MRASAGAIAGCFLGKYPEMELAEARKFARLKRTLVETKGGRLKHPEASRRYLDKYLLPEFGDAVPKVIPAEQIARSVLLLRGQRVLLDAELAVLYGVAVRALLQAVQRNRKRFPEDFMIRLTAAEWAALRSQFVTLKPGRGQHRKYLPYAFTEQGVAMLSSVLRSDRAIAAILSAIRELMNPPVSKRRPIGFTANLDDQK